MKRNEIAVENGHRLKAAGLYDLIQERQPCRAIRYAAGF